MCHTASCQFEGLIIYNVYYTCTGVKCGSEITWPVKVCDCEVQEAPAAKVSQENMSLENIFLLIRKDVS